MPNGESARVVNERRARPKSEGKLLSHRVNFISLRQEAEDEAPRAAYILQVADVNAVADMLESFGKFLLSRTVYAFETATQKALNEAACLIKDPDYHQTVKERRRRNRARRKDEEMEEFERRKKALTLEGVQRQIEWARENVKRYEKWTADSAEHLAELERKEAELIAAAGIEEVLM